MLEPGIEPDVQHSADQLVRDYILGENLKGEPLSSGIMDFLEYCKSVSRGVHPPSMKPLEHVRRLTELESEVNIVWNLKTEESLDDLEKRRVLAIVVLKACQTFIKICIDIMMSLVTEVEPHLKYWRDYSSSPRSFLHRCLIYNYIEPQYIGKKTPLFKMAHSNLTYLQMIHTKLSHKAGSFLRWYWRLQCVDVFPKQNEGVNFEDFLKEAYLLVSMEADESAPLNFPVRMNIPNLFDVFTRTVDKAKVFFTNIDRSVQESRKPHHLMRYFFLYAAGFVGSFTLSMLGFRTSSTIEKGLRCYFGWGVSLIEKYISHPFRRLFSSIFFLPKRTKIDSNALLRERGHLRDMLADYPARSTNGLIRHDEQLLKAEKLDMKLVMDTYTNDANNLGVSNTEVIPRLLRGLLIQMQADKIQKYEIHEQIDEILNASEATIYVLSLAPALTVLYGTTSILKRLYRGRSLDMVTYKYRFRRLILRLHSHIISLKDQSSKGTDKMVGKMLKTCERLRILTYNAVQSTGCYHNLNDKKLLEEDLQLFLDFEYDVNQRLRQLARMERFYL